MIKENVEYEIRVPVSSEIILEGSLFMPSNSRQFVIFAHGSGSSRLSSRNMFVAQKLREYGIGTLLIDLLTQWEDEVYSNRFQIGLLSTRVVAITRWLIKELDGKKYYIGYFGASTGAAAALDAAARLGNLIKAVVSRGGRPDLVNQEKIGLVTAPTLLIIGGDDTEVIDLNKEAFANLHCAKKIEIIPGATHLFEEQGKLEKVSELASEWFKLHLR